MNDKEFRKRADALLIQESIQPLAWWYLSFCDPGKPKGTQFLGACTVQAHGMADAITRAHRLGCNPGGEVAGWGPLPKLPDVWKGHTERLLSKAEIQALDAGEDV